MTSINDLPNEVLLLIFRNVSGKKELTITCRRWNALIGPMLHLCIDLGYVYNIEKFLKMNFTRPYQHLTIIGVILMRTELHWAGPPSFLRSKRARYEIDPFKIIRKCLELTRQLEPHLTKLSLSFGPTADNILMAFLPRGPGPSRLEMLKMVFNNWYLQQPEDWAIHQLAWVAKDDHVEVAEMPNLRKFHYEDTRSKGNRTIRRKLFDTIVRKAKGVKDISLQCTLYPCYPDFRIFRSYAKQLQHISCVIWPFFTKDFFQLTFPRAESMELCFPSCRSVPDTAVDFFANALCLTDLAVTNVHNSECFRKALLCKCFQLKKLRITSRHAITMDAIPSLCKLKELYLRSSDQYIKQIAVPCSQTLEKLVLDRCSVGISFYSVLAINVPYLVELHSIGDPLFNDEHLQLICSSLVNLRRLKIVLLSYASDPVSECGFQKIHHLAQLEYLYLEFVDSDYFVWRATIFATIFTDWVQQVAAPHVHLKGFDKFKLNHLLSWLLNPRLRELVIDSCGDDIRLGDGLKKLKELKNDIAIVRIINDDS